MRTDIQLAEACGFAIAVMQSFMVPQGTTGEQVMEAIEKLESVVEALHEKNGGILHEIKRANREAAQSDAPTRDEISYLLRGGEDRRRCVRIDTVVWSPVEREARRRA